MNVCESCPLINNEDCRKDCSIIKQAKKEAREEFVGKFTRVLNKYEYNIIEDRIFRDIDKLLKEYEEI